MSPTTTTTSPPHGRLHNRICIVTGSSSGLGRAISLAFAREGARVVCADLGSMPRKGNEKEAAEKETSVLIEEMGRDEEGKGEEGKEEEGKGEEGKEEGKEGKRALFVETDVGKAESVEGLVKKAVEWGGRVDVMVNNAGIALESGNPSSIWDFPEETWDTTLRVNAKGVFLGCKYAAKQMIGQEPRGNGDRGWIINTASILGLVGLRGSGTAAYTASKGAVVNLTRTVALELGQHRIHCNAICPGFTQTAMIKPYQSDPATNQHLINMHPFRGLGEPEDIARAAVFLAGDDASWITGVALPVDGGYTAM
ncbi:MAG: hypothetical protein M1812_007782 [Candelaria pacifica]|nr:MAG: hypothetical protein M1812_007782 [Candelaria pacifica]